MPFYFGNPLFLLGLFGVAVPIYLHLYYRKTPVRKFFPSLKLIKLSTQTLMNRMKLKNLLLLILRICVIAFLTMALAKPFISFGGNLETGSGSPSAFVVILDNSMSMGATHRGISLFNAAKSKAIEILDGMGPYDKASIVLMNDPIDVLFQQLSWDKNELKEAIRNTNLSGNGTNPHSALLAALKMLLPIKSFKKSVYVISDVTKTGWKNFVENFDLEKIPHEIDLVLVPIGEEGAPPNTAISDLALDTPIVLKGRSTPLRTTISNFSSSQQKTMLSIFIDGDKKHEIAIDLAPNEKKRVLASCTFPTEGVSHVRASLGGDSLPADDSRHLAVRVLAPQKVLIIHPPRLVEDKESPDDLFLRFALNPLDKRDKTTFLVERRTAEETNTLDLSIYTCVFLVNIRQLTLEFVKNLSSYLTSGGNVVIFSGSRLDPDWYNTHLIDELGASYILPARLVRRVGNSVAKNFAYQMTDLDIGHPVFKFFSDETNGDVSKSQIYEFFQVEPQNTALVLARLSHGLPAIVEEQRGQGRVMLVTFSADNSWTDWPLKPTFLPFVHQVVLGMISRGGLSYDSITPQTPINFLLREEGLQKVTLENPDGEKIDLPTRKEGSGLIMVSTAETEKVGFYKITATWKDKTWVSAFSVNSPPEESDLERFPISKIPRFIPIHQKPGTEGKLGDKITLVREGREMGIPFLWALLLITFLETLLANKPSGIITRTLTGRWNT
ncbi:MAG: BatA and WFA domain-containing protein [Candidatus Riflebacteria bacterium]|nr:BatA and WFA domain-containing protein [Candidatus Riflebacteria bacterium]